VSSCAGALRQRVRMENAVLHPRAWDQRMSTNAQKRTFT
jgi:hypothetical protein